MAEVVPDDLQREIGVHEALRDAVPKCVGTQARGSDPSRLEIAPCPLRHEPGGDRGPRRPVHHEDSTVGRLRPAVLDVVEKCLPNLGRQRIRRGVSSFAATDAQRGAPPLDVVEGQGGDLPARRP